jgi:anaerobic selenocysteine-containing dehydrogenase
VPTAAGIVLAGGRSLRMGTPKAALEWHGSPSRAPSRAGRDRARARQRRRGDVQPLLSDAGSPTCSLTLHVQDNEIVKVTSPDDQDVTRGNLCVKGRFGFQHVQPKGDEG